MNKKYIVTCVAKYEIQNIYQQKLKIMGYPDIPSIIISKSAIFNSIYYQGVKIIGYTDIPSIIINKNYK